MKIAYFFISPIGLFRLLKVILPELEAGTHSLDVVAMCFFDDNNFLLDIDHQIGRRLAILTNEKNITLMRSDRAGSESGVNNKDGVNATIYQRTKKPTECVVITIVDGQQVGCFPDFYAAVGDNRPDRLISL